MTEIADLCEKFDLIYSSLTFHYVRVFDTFAKNMYSVFNAGGQLLILQEHPIITSTVDSAQFRHILDEQIGGQLKAGFTLKALYEDRDGEGRNIIGKYYPQYVATFAVK
ncbi:MAG: hypothetical protein IKK09_02050 [Clostridia bacterium]|nr:hypothetical protein [Clostridia bacterium]